MLQNAPSLPGEIQTPQFYRLEQLPPSIWSWKSRNKCRVVFIPVKSGGDSEAIAISYPWGPNPHIEHVLPTRDHSLLKICLSKVFWTLENFLQSLWKATEGKPFWFDQMDLPSSSTATLHQIYSHVHTIFKTYPVRILTSTPPCELIASWQNMHYWTPDIIKHEMSKLEKHMHGCARCGRLDIWSGDLWARQHAYHATNIQLVYNDPVIDQQISMSSQFFSGWVSRLVPNLSRMMNDKTGVKNLVQPHQKDIDSNHVMELQWRLLRGDKLEFRHSVSFEDSLVSLGRSDVCASHPTEMIFAVWPALKGYVLPDDANHRHVIDLLDDACRQYARITGRQIPITYISRFAPTSQIDFLPLCSEVSIKPYVILPSPDVLSSQAWYGQWTPNAGMELDSYNRIHGTISQERIHLETLETFFDGSPTAQKVVELLAMTHKGHREWLYDQLHNQLTVQNPLSRPPDVMTSALNTVLHPLYGIGGFEEHFQIDIVVVILLLRLGIPVHLYLEHRAHIHFFHSNDNWIPALCVVEDTKDIRIMFTEGVRTAYLVKAAKWQIGAGSSAWEVVGMIPELEYYESETFNALCG